MNADGRREVLGVQASTTETYIRPRLYLCQLLGYPKLSWSESLALNVTAERVSIGVKDVRGTLNIESLNYSGARDFSEGALCQGVTGVAPGSEGQGQGWR